MTAVTESDVQRGVHAGLAYDGLLDDLIADEPQYADL